MHESLIQFRRIDAHRVACLLSPDARVRFWTIGNVVEVSNSQTKVTSLDGTVEVDGARANTSHLYLTAAQSQGLPVEYIEDAWPTDNRDEFPPAPEGGQ
ncbi:hypothetical protein [Microbacterium algeriense]|uniref:hypothetical protein n=1 Tax=Microbacterium algeriense TaxID=2615184 RepID=UPI003D71B9AD